MNLNEFHKQLADMPTSILAVIGLIIVMSIVGQLDYDEEQRQHAEYCEMVKLWKQTDGQAGWPAYNGEGMCQKEENND